MLEEAGTSQDESEEEFRIAKANRMKRERAERERMKKSGRSVFIIVETQKRRAQELSSKEGMASRNEKKKFRQGRR